MEEEGTLKLLIEVCAKTFIEISVEKMSKKGVSAFKLIYTIITDFSWLFVCFSVKDPICRKTQWNCGRLNNGPQDAHVLIPRTYDILYGKGDFAGVVMLRILGWGECPGLFRSAQCFEDRGRRTHTTRWRQSQSCRGQGSKLSPGASRKNSVLGTQEDNKNVVFKSPSSWCFVTTVV